MDKANLNNWHDVYEYINELKSKNESLKIILNLDIEEKLEINSWDDVYDYILHLETQNNVLELELDYLDMEE